MDSRLQSISDCLMLLNSQRSHSRGEYYRLVCKEMVSHQQPRWSRLSGGLARRLDRMVSNVVRVKGTLSKDVFWFGSMHICRLVA
jgi:hypothetical protein